MAISRIRQACISAWSRLVDSFQLPLEATNDVEQRTNTALGWFEQAQLVGDPLMEVLFCFMALEAILGDTHEGLKGPKLALRRAMLSLLTKGGFRHPSTATARHATPTQHPAPA